MDVTQEDAVKAAFEYMIVEYGGVDILVEKVEEGDLGFGHGYRWPVVAGILDHGGNVRVSCLGGADLGAR